MTNNKKIQIDYTTNRKNFQLVFSTNFELDIPADDSVRLLSNVLEELDYSQRKYTASTVVLLTDIKTLQTHWYAEHTIKAQTNVRQIQ